MTLLDRYIARLFLTNILTLSVALAGFVVGIDVFLNMRQFIGAAERMAPEGASTLWLVANTCLNVIDLWGPRLLQLFSYIIGLVLIAAMGFTLTTLVRRRELVAALASGVSLHRLALPFVAVGMALVTLAVANQEFVLPRIAHLLPRGPSDTFKRTIDAFTVPLLRDGSGRMFYAGRFDPVEERMERVHIWERDEQGRITRRIFADEAVWDGAGWALSGARVEALGGAPAPPQRIVTDLEPTTVLVKRVRGYGATLSWRQIDRMMRADVTMDTATRNRLQAIRFGRLSIASSNFLALLIVLPFFLVRQPVGMVARSLKAAPVAIGAMIGGALGAAAPIAGLPVELGVFIPPLLLTPLAIASLTSIRS